MRGWGSSCAPNITRSWGACVPALFDRLEGAFPNPIGCSLDDTRGIRPQIQPNAAQPERLTPRHVIHDERRK